MAVLAQKCSAGQDDGWDRVSVRVGAWAGWQMKGAVLSERLSATQGRVVAVDAVADLDAAVCSPGRAGLSLDSATTYAPCASTRSRAARWRATEPSWRSTA